MLLCFVLCYDWVCDVKQKANTDKNTQHNPNTTNTQQNNNTQQTGKTQEQATRQQQHAKQTIDTLNYIKQAHVNKHILFKKMCLLLCVVRVCVFVVFLLFRVCVGCLCCFVCWFSFFFVLERNKQEHTPPKQNTNTNTSQYKQQTQTHKQTSKRTNDKHSQTPRNLNTAKHGTDIQQSTTRQANTMETAHTHLPHVAALTYDFCNMYPKLVGI